jgi:hypothetical protein
MPSRQPTTSELIQEIRRIERRLGELDAALPHVSARRSRTGKIVVGSLAAVGGIALAPPTGGLTAFIAGLGLMLWADGLREDATMENLRRTTNAERRHLHILLKAIELELADREH